MITDDLAVPYLYLAIPFAIGLFFLSVLFSGRGLGYVLDLRQHEWYRELRRDYFTSRQQFWREWRGLKQFGRTNWPWLYGLGVGVCGLFLAAGLLLADLPEPISAAEVAADAPGTHQFATHVSTINSKAAAESFIVSATRNLLVQLPETKNIAAHEPANDPPQPTQPKPLDLNAFQPPPTEPALEETPTLARESIRPMPAVDEAAWEEFPIEPTPTPPPVPLLEVDVLFDTLPDFSEVFVVESVPEFDVRDAVARLESDDWVRGDPITLEEPSPPELYLERFGLARSDTGFADRASPFRTIDVPTQAAPGLAVRKMISATAVAGAELSYEIVVSNPTNEVVSGVVIQESLPATWDFINASVQGDLIRRDTLRWRIEPLQPEAQTSIMVRVLAGEEAEATTRTVVTTTAAVGASIEIGRGSPGFLEPVTDLGFLMPESDEPIPVAPSLPDPEQWRPIEQPIVAPDITEVERVPLTPQMALTAKVTSRVSLGNFKIYVTATNTGDTVIDDAVVKLWLSKLVKHSEGTIIEQAVGRLEPGQSRTLPVHLKAITPGDVVNRIELRSESTLYDSTRTRFTITRPPTSPEDPTRWRRR